MKVIKATGMVPLEFPGESVLMRIQGVSPKDAAAHLAAGTAKEVDIPEGVEFYEIEIKEPDLPVDAPVVDPRDSIEIPETWQDLSPPKLVKLAKQFDESVADKDAAAAVVTAELARRAALQTEQTKGDA
jgi:hypothetical protein